MYCASSATTVCMYIVYVYFCTAVWLHCTDVVKLLLQYVTDVNIKNKVRNV